MSQKLLSTLEKEIMDCVWNQKKSTVRTVHDCLEKKIAYTTVATLLQRLFEKQMVTRVKEKNINYFIPKISKLQYTRLLATSFVRSFLSSYGEVAIASFAESIEELPKKNREYLLELLQKHEEKE